MTLLSGRKSTYALEDVINISRPKPGASCLACKTAEYEKLNIENGDNLFSMDFQQTVQDVEFGIICYNCHRNKPGEIQTTSPHFNAALGKSLKKYESSHRLNQ